jgi:23S rRNA (cytosine1962-C5)-methyltransferase
LVARVLRFSPGPIDRDWFADRFARALALRREAVPAGTGAWRLVHAEGDGLPGLIIDRYGEVLVVQCLTAGMARLQRLWLPALAAALPVRAIIAKAERARRSTGPELPDGLLWGEPPGGETIVAEGGLRFAVPLAGGQKTGLYLDQRENRALVAQLAAGREVLDAFCYTGGFGLYAAAAGARRVTAVDTSAAALALLERNWQLNGLPPERLRIVREPVQRFLRGTEERFDLTIVDPPSFAKSLGEVAGAARAYKDLNLWALRRLAPGGYLATFSCSQHVEPDLFQKILFGASQDAGRAVQWLRRLGAGPDHPVQLQHPQGEYLKGMLLRAGSA